MEKVSFFEFLLHCLIYIHVIIGTLTELLKSALGNYFGELNLTYFTNYSKGEDAPNNNLFNIRNARLVNTSEIGTADNNEPQKFLTHKLKSLSGGDEINCRQPHSNKQMSFKSGKLWIQTNIMPSMSGKKTDNVALMQRVEIIEFPFSFVDDLDLIASEPEKYKLRSNDIKAKFRTALYGQVIFINKICYVSKLDIFLLAFLQYLDSTASTPSGDSQCCEDCKESLL